MNVQTAPGPDQGLLRTAPGIARHEVSLGANVTTIAVAGQRLAAGLGDGRVVALSEAGPQDLARHTGAVTQVGVLANGSVLSGGQDGAILSTRAEAEAPHVIHTGNDWINAMAICPAGTRAAFAVGKRVMLLEDGKVIARFDDHPSTVSGLAFFPDGKRLAASRYNGISLWSLETLAKPVSLDWAGSVTSVSVSPDGRYVAGATQDREVHVWDLVSGKDFRLGGYQRKVKTIGWSDDTTYLYTSGADVLVAWGLAGDPGAIPPVEIGYAFSQTVTAVAPRSPKEGIASGFSDGSVIIGEVRKGTAKIARPNTGQAITAIDRDPSGIIAYGGACGCVGLLNPAHGSSAQV